MTVFENLLGLYKRGESLKTPMEDFCTEALSGILNSDPVILQQFTDDILELPSEEKYHLKTQQSYFNREDKQIIVDMVFESSATICFLEMKVYAKEGYNQLDRYDHQLDELSRLIGKTTRLRYCTLYTDPKKRFKESDHFAQFRWADIAEFLKAYLGNNQLINEFYQFLKEKKMTGNERFNHEDLIGLKVYAEIAGKVNEVFSLVEEKLSTFGTLSGGLIASRQITNYNRWATFCNGVIGENGSEVLVSFDFQGSRYKDEPVISVQLFVNQKNTAYKKFVEVSTALYQDKKYEDKDIFSVGEHGAHIRFEKPIAVFFNTENQLNTIANWAENRLDHIAEFRSNHDDLDWRFQSIVQS